jgi:hypothetical protein
MHGSKRAVKDAFCSMSSPASTLRMSTCASKLVSPHLDASSQSVRTASHTVARHLHHNRSRTCTHTLAHTHACLHAHGRGVAARLRVRLAVGRVADYCCVASWHRHLPTCAVTVTVTVPQSKTCKCVHSWSLEDGVHCERGHLWGSAGDLAHLAVQVRAPAEDPPCRVDGARVHVARRHLLPVPLDLTFAAAIRTPRVVQARHARVLPRRARSRLHSCMYACAWVLHVVCTSTCTKRASQSAHAR